MTIKALCHYLNWKENYDYYCYFVVIIIITPEKRIGFSIAKDGQEHKFQEADMTPKKSQLDFKDVIFVGSNVSISACPIQGTSFTGTDDSRQANDTNVMPCIAKIKSPVWWIDFEAAPEN